MKVAGLRYYDVWLPYLRAVGNNLSNPLYKGIEVEFFTSLIMTFQWEAQ